MSLLSKLTIVIPTFNRPEYVIRSIRYWSDYDVTVHVLDGSKVPIEGQLFSKLGSNINYHHLPIGLMERLYKSINLVDTEYSMMIPDDEFFIPSALESCIKEMKKNHEIVSCAGSAISFRVRDKEVIGNVIYPKLKDHSIMYDSPLERSVYHMSNYVPSTIFSVMRSDIWKKSIRSLSYKNYEVFVRAVGELQFEITSSYLGKCKVIDELMWLRSFENIPIRVQESEETLNIKDFWFKESSRLIRDEIIDTIVLSISSKEDKMSSISQDISMAFEAYIENQPKKPVSYIVAKATVTAKAILPKSILFFIKRLLLKIIEKNSLLSIPNIISVLKKEHVKVDIIALEEIEKIILKYNSNKII
jgi:glycosyltransferase domain-containing protein